MMTHCYMCGRLLKKEAEMLDVTVDKDILVWRTYTVCKKCSKKIDTFIKSKRAINSKRKVLEDTPTSNFVEVVRCKDCTEWDKNECECSRWHGFREDDYCSYGERKI